VRLLIPAILPLAPRRATVIWTAAGAARIAKMPVHAMRVAVVPVLRRAAVMVIVGLGLGVTVRALAVHIAYAIPLAATAVASRGKIAVTVPRIAAAAPQVASIAAMTVAITGNLAVLAPKIAAFAVMLVAAAAIMAKALVRFHLPIPTCVLRVLLPALPIAAALPPETGHGAVTALTEAAIPPLTPALPIR